MYQVIINTRLCKGCGLCADFCPKNVYEINIGHPVVAARSSQCINCKLCLMKCPDFAITIEEVHQ